jgi:hypothetical protein
MRRAALLVRTLALALAAGRAPAVADEVSFFRVADEGSLTVTAARATRGAGPDATTVIVLEGARGNRLFLRRAPQDGGTAYQVWLGGPPGVTFTRRGDTVLLEAGGRSLTIVEGELQRPTVSCWVAALAASVEPKLLDVAAGLRLLKEQTGGPPLDDAFLPIRILWPVAPPSDVRWRGAVRFLKGPFEGEAFDRLAAAAKAELGRR